MRIKRKTHPVSTVKVIPLQNGFRLFIIPALWDNYSYLLEKDKTALLVDPADSKSVQVVLNKHSINLKSILVTHDHIDHITDIQKIIKYNSAEVFAFHNSELPGKYVPLENEARITFSGLQLQIIHSPGHSKNNCIWYLEQLGILFTGDTLFFCGYGYIFDDSLKMFESLQKIKKLPDNTLLFFGHEYTRSNIKFTLTREPDNPVLFAESQAVMENLQNGLPAVPSALRIQKKINLFLRYDNYQDFRKIRQIKIEYNKGK